MLASPLRARAALRELPHIALLALAALFASSVAAGPHLFDAGELVAASVELGGSHPPGQPLHALLSHAFLWLPVGPMPARISLFSAVTVLIAAALGGRLCREVGDALGAGEAALRWAETAAVVGIAFATPVLRQALRPEVYGLALALTLWAVLHLFRWVQSGGTRHLVFGAFIAGLTACVHPPHALAIVGCGAALAACFPQRLRYKPWSLVPAALATLTGLLGYAYLPLRGAGGARMWGRTSDLSGLLEYVTARAYVGRGVHESSSRLLDLRDYALHLMAIGGALGALGILASALSQRGRKRRVGLGFLIAGGLAVVSTCLQPLEVKNPDNVAYLAPALALLTSTGAASFGALTRAPRGALRALGAIGIVAIAANPHSLSRVRGHLDADLPVLETFGAALWETPPARALVVATSDFAASTWLMAQQVERARPDVALFVAGLSTSSWQWAQLARHPAFDGKPRRAEGSDPHSAYLRGAVRYARQRVPVALERDLWGLPRLAHSGAYVLAYAHGQRAPLGPLRRSIGERLAKVLYHEVQRSPAGDHGAAAAIVRDYFVQRARRQLSLDLPEEAVATMRDALWPLPPAQRALLRAPDEGTVRNLPPVVGNPQAFSMSRAEAVRAAAALVWAGGHRGEATKLLKLQAGEGGARALLQLGWLQLFDGDRERAARSLALFRAQAPELAAEAVSLEKALAKSARASAR